MSWRPHAGLLSRGAQDVEKELLTVVDRPMSLELSPSEDVRRVTMVKGGSQRAASCLACGYLRLDQAGRPVPGSWRGRVPLPPCHVLLLVDALRVHGR